MREQRAKEDTRYGDAGTSAAPTQHDFVDHLLKEWKALSPWIDATPVAIIVRMKRATAIFDKARERLGTSFGIGNGEIMVLDALRRVGPPNRLNPSRLLQELLAPSGTMTSWLDKLAKLGFVKRTADPDDRRGVLVQLTSRGRRVVSEMDKLAREQWHGTPHAALAQFTPGELNTLAGLLRRLCISLENDPVEKTGDEARGGRFSTRVADSDRIRPARIKRQ